MGQWPQQWNSIMSLFLTTTRHPYLLASFRISALFTVHHPNPVTITQSDCTLRSINGSLLHGLPGITCFQHYICPSDGQLLLSCSRTSNLERRPPFFCNISSFVSYFGESEAVTACETVHCVCYLCMCV